MPLEGRKLHVAISEKKKLVQYTEIGMTRKLISRRKVSDTQRSDIRLAI